MLSPDLARFDIQDGGGTVEVSTLLIDAVIHFRILTCFLLSIQRSLTERKLYRDFRLNRRIL